MRGRQNRNGIGGAGHATRRKKEKTGGSKLAGKKRLAGEKQLAETGGGGGEA